MSDPYWDNVVLALPMDGADGSTVFTDLKGKTVTTVGNARISTAQSKFGGAAGYFDGVGDSLTISSSADFNFGINDFTIEAYVYPTSVTGYRVIFGGSSTGELALYHNGSSLELGRWGIAGICESDQGAITLNNWQHVVVSRVGNLYKLFVNGDVVANVTQSNSHIYGGLLRVGADISGGNSFNGYIDDLRITTYGRYTDPFTPLSSSYFDGYGTLTRISASLQQPWDDVAQAAMWIDQEWGLKLGVNLVQPWSDAAVIKGLMAQYWGDAAVIQSPLLQQWRDAVLLRAQLDQPWSVPESLLVALEQQWSLTSAMVQGALDQAWDLKDIEQVVAVLHQPWAIATDGSVLRYTVEILAGGLPVRVSHVNVEAALDQDVVTCEIHPDTEAEYLLCYDGAPLQLTITSQEGTEMFTLVVTAPRIDEQHGETSYVVEAMSPLALLGEPYAATMDGELTGLASALAATLAAPLAITWQTVDWHIPPSTWIASGQTPLALLKQLAGAVGAVVQSAADGSVLIIPEYPLALPAWATATPGLILTEILDCWTTGSTPDHRLGYNRYLIGDQMSSNDSLRLEEASISATLKEVRGYQTPWTGTFELIHTGGAWVTIEPLGIEERQETETVEIVAGSGRVQYPIYHRDAITWGQVNLGSVTFAEEGSLSASVAGESLLTITYTTRCRLWRVRNAQSEQLQLVAEL